jgi:hypothetical protein
MKDREDYYGGKQIKPYLFNLFEASLSSKT